MTYEQLKEKIMQMTAEQLACDVTVFNGNDDEYYPIDHLELTNDQEDDRLDDGHPFMVMLTW